MEMEKKVFYNNNNNINLEYQFSNEIIVVEHRKWHRRRRKRNNNNNLNHKLRVYSSSSKQQLFLFLNFFSLERRKWLSFWKLKIILVLFLLHFFILFLSSSLFLYSTASEISKNETNYFEENIYKNFTENIWQQIDENNEEENQNFKRKLTKKQLLFTQMGLIKENKLKMCHIWNKRSPSELCSLNKWERIKRMNELSLFTICANGFSNLQLSDIFQLNNNNIDEINLSESSLNLFISNNFKKGQLGQSCILGGNSSECLICFERLGKSLEKLEKFFWSFSQLLQRFDCRQQYFEKENNNNKQQISTTRPFSPNTTCDNCAEWYRKWLLVNLLDIWKKKGYYFEIINFKYLLVCINWCYYTQLACPHLATNKVVEFAGHPVFLCKDQMLSSTKNKNIFDCSCLHPCDLINNKIAQFNNNFNSSSSSLLLPLLSSSSHFNNNKKQQKTNSFDFFHVSAYCQNREKRCQIKTKKKN